MRRRLQPASDRWILGAALIGQRFATFRPWKNPERNIFRGTPSSENVYRPENGDGGDRSSVASELLPRRLTVNSCCMCVCVEYLCIL